MLTILFIQTLHRREIFQNHFVITYFPSSELTAMYFTNIQSYTILRVILQFVVNLLYHQNSVVRLELMSPS